MGKILAIAGGIPTGILLAALTGCMLAIRNVREKQQQDMQNEKGGSRHELDMLAEDWEIIE